MSRAPEVAQAEAIAALTTRLHAWGVDDAAERAHEFVRDLIREGWRPRAPRCELTPPAASVDPRRDRKPTESPEYLAAKAALKGGA